MPKSSSWYDRSLPYMLHVHQTGQNKHTSKGCALPPSQAPRQASELKWPALRGANADGSPAL